MEAGAQEEPETGTNLSEAAPRIEDSVVCVKGKPAVGGAILFLLTIS